MPLVPAQGVATAGCSWVSAGTARAGRAPWGSDGVVVGLPVLQQVLGVTHAREAMLVQELVSHATVEALGVGLLDRLAQSDEVMLDATPVALLVESLAGEFQAVVGSGALRCAASLDCPVQDAQHPLRW